MTETDNLLETVFQFALLWETEFYLMATRGFKSQNLILLPKFTTHLLCTYIMMLSSQDFSFCKKFETEMGSCGRSNEISGSLQRREFTG
jgi:hypothetical protein